MSCPPTSEAVWARERDFHDAAARRIDADALAREWVPDRLDLALRELAGEVRERAVLDAGCGQGDMTLDLLANGAKVTALDISAGMIDIVRQRVGHMADQQQSFAAVAAPFELSGLADDSFDLIVGKYFLHHIDVDAGAAEISRLLRPGGRAIFIENSGGNPLLALARKRLVGRWGVPRYGTEDEHPLTKRDLDDLRPLFARVTAHYPVFEFLVLFDRQILRFRYPLASRAMRWLDDAIYRRLPRLRRFSYRIVVELAA